MGVILKIATAEPVKDRCFESSPKSLIAPALLKLTRGANEGTYVERFLQLSAIRALIIACVIAGGSALGQNPSSRASNPSPKDSFPVVSDSFRFQSSGDAPPVELANAPDLSDSPVADAALGVSPRFPSRSVVQEAIPMVDPVFRFPGSIEVGDARGPVVVEANAPLQPWWSAAIANRATAAASPEQTNAAFVGRPWELEQLLWLAIAHSPFVNAIRIEPQVLQSRADIVLGQFDPEPFIDSIFHDTSDPVGNTLVTGSANRLLEQQWDNSSGIRGKNIRGGQTEFSQQFLFKDNNSEFFLPNNQADTKMFLRYTQPLMRGRGQLYNQSTYVIASLAANQSFYEVSAKIQRHAFDITSSYWELFADRASYAQTERGLERLRQLNRQLAGRSNLDSLRSQQLRGEAAIARQSAALARFLAQIKTSEANLRAAVAAPELLDRSLGDVVPATPTADWRTEIQRDQELTLALESHPQIQAIRTNLRASRTRLQVAEHELRPTLDLVMESYVRGLNGDFDAAKSFGDQFSEGSLSYAAGLSFTRPYRNTAARAALRENRLELQRHLLELENELLVVAADVEGAIAHIDAAYQQLDSAVRSTLATHAELEYLTARWKNAFLDGTQSSLLLDQLLNAEIQLIQSENSWARAQADHMIALAKLRLASGTLLTFASLKMAPNTPANDLPNHPPAAQ